MFMSSHTVFINIVCLSFYAAGCVMSNLKSAMPRKQICLKLLFSLATEHMFSRADSSVITAKQIVARHEVACSRHRLNNLFIREVCLPVNRNVEISLDISILGGLKWNWWQSHCVLQHSLPISLIAKS